ncbi:MAG: hypothetical protein JXB62_09915 [Pirellulales bacterium]|nr:hypothetical protein [Pirellulales bacterium]
MGGADLECLGYETLRLKDLEAICDADFCSQLQPQAKGAFAAAEDDHYAFLDLPRLSSVSEFSTWLQERCVSQVFLNFVGLLLDLEVPISVSADLIHKVVCISTPESMLWGFSEDRRLARFERLGALFTLCEQVCSARTPVSAIIGSEPCHKDEVLLTNPESAEGLSFIANEFFSEGDKRNLFDWYVNVYARRWEKAYGIE